jgi:hypothetical protein
MKKSALIIVSAALAVSVSMPAAAQSPVPLVRFIWASGWESHLVAVVTVPAPLVAGRIRHPALTRTRPLFK